MTHHWRDTGLYYGLVTRLFHWSMALLICWQFSGMVIGAVFGRSALTDMLNGTHGSLGVTILILAILRAFWGLYNLKDRPAHERNLLGLAARAGHLLLYLLMIVVPGLALLRAIGGNRGLTLWGIQFMEAGGERIGWMTAPASLLHGTLAWLMLAMIGGHIAMVMIHKHVWKDQVLGRMVGRTRHGMPAE